MIYAELPPVSEPRRLPFYLAMEEHLARNYPGKEFFFMWQVRPTVIYGRCQNPLTEVNLDFCRSHGIQVYRRKSGGGCVFADMNNIMFSYITTSEEGVPDTFARYCSIVADTLRGLGLDARSTGRNDIIIGDRKVSGNAFYSLHDRSILHGTMLFDADLPLMTRAITPSEAKLMAKGVASVRSRVTTIREHLPELGIEEFKEFVRCRLCDATQLMTPEDIAAIEAIERPYFSKEWLEGRFYSESSEGSENSNKFYKSYKSYIIYNSRRIEGVGEFKAEISLIKNDAPAPTSGAAPTSPAPIIADVSLGGDFFLLGDLENGLLRHLRGLPYTREAVLGAVKALPSPLSGIIPGLTPEALLSVLFSQ